MEKFQDVALGVALGAPTIGGTGDVVALIKATITVYDAGTTNVSSIYSDDEPVPTPQDNPFLADAQGRYSFYAADGTYDVKIAKEGFTTYSLLDVSVEAVGSPGAVKNNFTATTAPGITDDSTQGYAVGSQWVDTVADISYVCVDALSSAAVWNRVNPGLLNNLTATIAPTVNDDTNSGYSVGSLWLGSALESGYICKDASAGAAVWSIITDRFSGIAGGQTLYGGTGTGENLTIDSTTNATKGSVIIQPSGGLTHLKGKVALGADFTTNAAYTFESKGDYSRFIRTATTASIAEIFYDSGSASSYIACVGVGGSISLSYDSTGGTLRSTNLDLHILSNSGRDIVFQTDLVAKNELARITSNGRVAIGTPTPATSALLDLSSTTGALLIPRMTTTQRDALTAAEGMIIYNTTTTAFNIYENGAWVAPLNATTAENNMILKTYAGAGGASIGTATIRDMHTGVHSRGIFTHNGLGVVTINGTSAVDVTAGAIAIRPTDNKADVLEYLEWSAVTNHDLSGFASGVTVYVYLDYTNGSTIQYSATDPDPTDEAQNVIKLAEVHRNGTTIYQIHDLREYVGNHPQEMAILHREVFGVLISDQVFSETGTRNVAISAGTFHLHGYNNKPQVAFDSSATDTFTYFYQGGGEVAAQTTLDNLQYDNAGTLTTLDNNKWKKDWLYRNDAGSVFVVYGQAQYADFATAVDAATPSLPPIVADQHAHLLGVWICEKSAVSGTVIDKRNSWQNTVGGGGGGASDHGSLTGLSDPDHPATAIINTPAGNISSTNVQAAINELDASMPNRNYIIAGGMDIWLEGTSFPAANDATYTDTLGYLLSDGNAIVDVAEVANGQGSAWQATINTISKKFGRAYFLESSDAKWIIENGIASLSFEAAVNNNGAGRLDNIKAVLLSWDGTVDTLTKDVVSVWNAEDTTPTWAANWTAENVPANLSVGTTLDGTRYKVENIAVDTASVKNLCVFVWADGLSATAADTLQITNLKLEAGAVATPFEGYNRADELVKVGRSARIKQQDGTASHRVLIGTGQCISTTQAYIDVQFNPEMRSEVVALTVGTIGGIRLSNSTGGGIVTTGLTVDETSKHSMRLLATVASGLVAGNATQLYLNVSSSSSLLFDARL